MKTSNQNSTATNFRTAVIKRSGAVLLSAFCLVGLASCENEDDDPIVDTISQQDRDFAVASSAFINAQISLGQLATEKGQDDSVLEYADLILTDNTASKAELEGIVESKDVELSTELTAEMQAKYDELALLQGEAFDKAFISFQLGDLEDSKSMFENQIDNGQNFTLKGYADKTLELVKSHRTKALLVKASIDIGAWWLAASVLVSGFLTTIAFGRVFLFSFWRPVAVEGNVAATSAPAIGIGAQRWRMAPILLNGPAVRWCRAW